MPYEIKTMVPLSTSRSITASDLGSVLVYQAGASVALNVPSDANAALPIGAYVELRRLGYSTGATVTADSGVSVDNLIGPPTALPRTITMYGEARLSKQDVNHWVLSGAVQ